MAENQIIDLDGMSFNQKKNFLLRVFSKLIILPTLQQQLSIGHLVMEVIKNNRRLFNNSLKFSFNKDYIRQLILRK